MSIPRFAYVAALAFLAIAGAQGAYNVWNASGEGQEKATFKIRAYNRTIPITPTESQNLAVSHDEWRGPAGMQNMH